MKISLVTISFNQQAYLERAIRSVIDQQYPELEYILVDPGSTDGSGAIIDMYRARISKVLSGADDGPADGLRKGFEAASGDVFAFLNADDLLLPDSLRTVAEYFGSRPECDVLMGDGFIVDTNDRVLRHVRAHSFSLANQIYCGTRWLQQSTFFRADIYRKVGGFNIDNRTCWDGELFLDFAANGANVQFLHKNLSCFRFHDASFTVKNMTVPSRPHVAEYLADHRRMFRKVSGREWTGRDTIRTYLARSCNFLMHPGDAVQAVAHRFRQRFEGARPKSVKYEG